MTLCRVLGSVTSTAKHPKFSGLKLLVVEPVDERGSPNGKSFLAVDHVQAGEGDLVLVMREGNGVRQIFRDPQLPIRSVIAGIVDSVDVPR
jgi:microcompartment protein CcmK/EutM